MSGGGLRRSKLERLLYYIVFVLIQNFYSHMLNYETLFEGVFRVNVLCFEGNFYIRCFYRQVLNRKV